MQELYWLLTKEGADITIKYVKQYIEGCFLKGRPYGSIYGRIMGWV